MLSATNPVPRLAYPLKEKVLNLIPYLEEKRQKEIEIKKQSEYEVDMTEKSAMVRFYIEFDKLVTLMACTELSAKPSNKKLADYVQSQKAGDAE